MNKAQKEVLQAGLRDEQHTIKLLQAVYKRASQDCADKISALSARTDMENIKSIIWQKQYQEALKRQLDGIIDQMGTEQFTTVADYLQTCYTNGYIGVMYDLNKQGIPCTVPINQKQVVKALDLDSKISKGLYSRMGEDVNHLKKSIRAEISRGVANGSTWNEIAQKIATGMNSPFDRAINSTIRIARTEGHRIQQASALDAQTAAKDAGADVKKQWCSTLDDRTRETHRQLDGVIVEVDEEFTLPGGLHAQCPGGFGDPAEDVNCRCTLLQRATWGLDEKELDTLKERADFFGLDKSDQFEDFREKYLNIPDDADKVEVPDATEGYTDCQTTEEAVEYMRTQLGLNTSGCEAMNVNIANMVNREITNAYAEFGNLHTGGVLDGVRILTGKQSFVAAYSPPMKEVFLKKGNVSRNVVNKLAKEAKEQFKAGFWSTGSAEHSIRHELGHAIEKMLGRSDQDKMGEISSIRQSIMQELGIKRWSILDTPEHMQAAGGKISYYALRDDGEFIAESVAEYLNGDPRETAKQVVDILMRK